MIPVLMPVHGQAASFLPISHGGFSLTVELGLQRQRQYINFKPTASTQRLVPNISFVFAARF